MNSGDSADEELPDVRLSMDEFCRLAGEVVDSFPDEFLKWMDNVVIDVRNRPTRRQLESLGIESMDDAPLGLFEGPSVLNTPEPLDDQLHAFAPSRIWLFKRPIEEVCRSPDEVAYEIRRTIIHEVAHHFGWSEEDLDEFESHPSPFDPPEST
jgi:predicted Zn-dependent protease with MMP-like domain